MYARVLASRPRRPGRLQAARRRAYRGLGVRIRRQWRPQAARRLDVRRRPQRRRRRRQPRLARWRPHLRRPGRRPHRRHLERLPPLEIDRAAGYRRQDSRGPAVSAPIRRRLAISAEPDDLGVALGMDFALAVVFVDAYEAAAPAAPFTRNPRPAATTPRRRDRLLVAFADSRIVAAARRPAGSATCARPPSAQPSTTSSTSSVRKARYRSRRERPGIRRAARAGRRRAGRGARPRRLRVHPDRRRHRHRQSVRAHGFSARPPAGTPRPRLAEPVRYHFGDESLSHEDLVAACVRSKESRRRASTRGSPRSP